MTDTNCEDNKLEHKWVWIGRWKFKCENCKLIGDFDDGYVSVSESW